MKVLLVYPGATWSPYDVATGYEAALRELGHEVLAFPLHKYYALFIQMFEQWEHDARLMGAGGHKENAGMWASRMCVAEAVEFAPDVALVVMGISFHVRAYLALYALGIPVATILTESPYADEMQAGMLVRSHAALAFTNDRTSVFRLEALFRSADFDPVPTVYLPHSYNPERHKVLELDDGLRRQFGSDIFFHGTLWEQRAKLLAGLENEPALRPYNVHISGARFSHDHQMLQGKLISNDEMVMWYNCTKIAINHHRREMHGGGTISFNAHSLGPRAFEIAASGAFMLTDYRPEIEEVFGDTVAVYTDRQDLIAKATYYLEHEDEREEMAAAAQARVAKCSFLDRCRDLVVPAIEMHLLGGAVNASSTDHSQSRQK